MKKLAMIAAALILLSSCSRRTETGMPVSDAGTEAIGVAAAADYTIRSAEREDRGSLTRAIGLRDLELEKDGAITVVRDRRADRTEVLDATLADLAAGESVDLVIGGFCETLAPLYAAGAIKRIPGECETAGAKLIGSGGSRYFITTPVVPTAFGDVSCVLMNCEVAERFRVTGVFDAVRSGEWRWDSLAGIAAVIPPSSGLYRFAVADGSLGPSTVLSSMRTVTENAGNGVAVKRTLRGDADAPLERARAVLSAAGTTYREENAVSDGAERDAARSLFAGSEALFLFCKTGDIPGLRGTGCEFRIFPYPGSPGKTGYVTGADSVRGAAAALPRGADDAAAAAVLPALCRTSKKYLLPEATDAMLSGPSSYDSESAPVLSELFGGARYEASLAFAGEGGAELERILTNAATGKGTTAGWEMKAAEVRRRLSAAGG